MPISECLSEILSDKQMVSDVFFGVIINNFDSLFNFLHS
jgi:hypothetical protein